MVAGVVLEDNKSCLFKSRQLMDEWADALISCRRIKAGEEEEMRAISRRRSRRKKEEEEEEEEEKEEEEKEQEQKRYVEKRKA